MRIISRKTQVFQGISTPPASKSDAIRALIFALVCPGVSTIDNVLEADDVNDAIKACESMGALIQREGSRVTVNSPGAPFCPITPTLYTGQSGLATRFMLPLLGLRSDSHIPMNVACGPQMQERPMGGLIRALGDLGMTFTCHETPHSLPLSTTGALRGGHVTLDEPISQYVSALAIALPMATESSLITVSHVPARSYIEMTFEWLKRLGIQYTHRFENNVDTLMIPGNQQYRPFEYTVPGDFSSASYLIAAGALLNGTVRLKGLNMHNTQGDKQLVHIIQEMGGDITFDGADMVICGAKPLKGISIDASNIPDLLPTLAVLGTAASGVMTVYNVAQARLKETDRIHSMTEGLKRMGAHIEENADGMIIHASPLTGAHVKGYGDHRTVMALSLAGMLASSETHIDDAEAIHKTFPHFVEEMKSLGAHMELTA